MYGGGVEIIGNVIFNNSRAIATDAHGIPIENNTITENQEGIVCWAAPEIHENNIWNNFNFNFYNDGLNDANANNNWWGTINKTLIENTLTGLISFEPILNSPNPAAPPIPTEYLSSQQTSPSGFSGFDWLPIVVLAATVFAVGLAVAVCLMRQKPKHQNSLHSK